MQKNTSKVYVKVDKQNRILCCEGGYTTPNDLTEKKLVLKIIFRKLHFL